MLTEHFSLNELVFSEYAVRHHIDNTPDDEIVANLQMLADGLERCRAVLGNRPMIVSSGYRSPKVNSGIGGSKGSYHMKGLAADFRVVGMDTADACALLDTMKLKIKMKVFLKMKYMGMTVMLDTEWIRREVLNRAA